NRLTQASLAGRLGVPEYVPHRWESGHTPITAKELRLLAHTLRVPPSRLQQPLPQNPTLADLRTHLALTIEETAARLRMKSARLRTWETGVLGFPNERGALLAAIIAVSPALVADYEDTGVLPRPLARRLAPVLRTASDEVVAAFAASHHMHQLRDAQAAS
ncbi:MAG TPA: helix-turn-helix transcriptional regulator, partial [Umezawaea sp.]|nr:helix-turn-helix transcriptional regulator [Umezawaea sp.]